MNRSPRFSAILIGLGVTGFGFKYFIFLKTSQELWMLSSVTLFVGQVMSPHNSDLLSQRSEVSGQYHPLRVFSKFLCHCLCLSLSFGWSSQVSSSIWSNVSKVTSLWDSSFREGRLVILVRTCLPITHIKWKLFNHVIVKTQSEMQFVYTGQIFQTIFYPQKRM